MSFVNYSAKEIHLKVVYYGAGLCGKTTNIQYIYEHTDPSQRGKLVHLSAENERTLFFDFLPLSVGEVRGYKTRFHLYSVPGQTFYEIPRQFILKGIDGVVFVVDSQESRMDANLESFENLQKALEYQGYDPAQVPVVFQFNKRDLPDAVSIDELNATFNGLKRPAFEAVANQGQGVMETLTSVSQLIIQDIKGGKTA